ncbi:MAG: hypothetical protein Q9191_007002 [Dirinaria sp. TL-2023a]
MEASNGGPSRSPSGSVRRARQRAGQMGDGPRVTINPDPIQIDPQVQQSSEPQYSQYTPRGNRQPPMPPMPSIPSAHRPPPINTSAPPTQTSPGKRTNIPSPEFSGGRGPPPQRPPRPNFLPSLIHPSQRAQFSEQHPEYWEGMSPHGQDQFSERYSSGSSRPTTGSASSSPGPIPDFPVPSNPPTSSPTPRRIPNLGPPPSARKGGATYFSPNSFVAPIPEEQPESHNSYASSHAIPASWGDGPPENYLDGGIDEEDEDGVGSSGRQSRAGDHDESTGLVRKVSIGKAGKPALRSIKSGEGLHDPRSPQEPSATPKAGLGAVAVAAASGSAIRSATSPRNNESKGQLYPQVEDTYPRVQQVLGGLEKGGALASSGRTSPFSTATSTLSEKGGKRPARLNLEVVKENEGTRGSTSSLPELIRRATKLASNLDRGRTASRLGFLNMLEDKERARFQSPRGSRPGSITDILAAFPSPSLKTPTGDHPGSRWPSPMQKTGLSRTHTAAPGSPTSYDEKHRSRKCCGMPIWAFALLTIILILLIAAAVVIPVTLIVLPKKNTNGASPNPSSCKSSTPCSNGGINVLVSNSCGCVCVNGFTGSTCTAPSDSYCTSTDIPNANPATVYKNATLGNALPRLLTAAQSNFSLPLSSQSVLSKFSAQNLTCNSENALVNFDGSSQRRSLPIKLSSSEKLLEAAAPLPLLVPTSTISAAVHTLGPRIVSSIISNTATDTAAFPGPTSGAITSNGIILAATPSASASSPSASSSGNNTSSAHNVTQQDLDFARTVVLFIFQEKPLDTAVTAQEKLQQALRGVEQGKTGPGYNMSAMDAGQSIVVDFEHFTVDFGNGTQFGGGPGG